MHKCCIYPVMTEKYPNKRLLRTDDAFDNALEDLRHLEMPVLNRSDYLRKLVFEAHRKAIKEGRIAEVVQLRRRK